MTGQKTFPLEKILTVSAGDYIERAHKDHIGRSYEMVGVHVEIRDIRNDSKLIEEFANSVPGNAEVVVDYKPSMVTVDRGIIRMASGTALTYKEYTPQPNP